MTEKSDRHEIIVKVLIPLFFISVFLSLITPIFDPDFWWHLASGKWMWENKSLMHDDTFGIGFHESSINKKFFLKQYWLSQLLFYGIYSLADFRGLIIFTSFVFTIMFLTLYTLMRNQGAGRILAVSFVYISIMIIGKEIQYIGTRPQMFTSLFSVVVLYFLEAFRNNKKWTYIALPALMLLWSNMHGGFIFGDIIIAIYIIGAIVSFSGRRFFYIVSIIAILLSGLNPNGFTAFLTAFDVQYYQYFNFIVENQSIFKHANNIVGIVRGLPYLSALSLFSIISFALNIRQIKGMRKELILLYALVFIMGLKSIRFIIFFTVIASFITAINLKDFIGRHPLSIRIPKKAIIVLTILVIVAITAQFVTAGIKNSALSYAKPYVYVDDYKKAADFIKTNHLKGNMFNDLNIGGYLIWRLWPDVKIFIDGRLLYYKAFKIYRQVIDNPYAPIPDYGNMPNYAYFLEYFKINLVIIPGCDKVSGTIIQLALALIKDDRWALIYVDDNALIFMRDVLENRDFIKEYSLPKTDAYYNIFSLAFAASKSMNAYKMSNWKLSVAIAHDGRGNIDNALYWINEYLKSVPNDSNAILFREKLQEKARSKNY